MVFPFSNRTIVRLAEAIVAGNSHTTMDALFYECSANKWEDPTASNKLAKALNLLRALQDDGSDAASACARELMTSMLKVGKPLGFSGAAGWYAPLVGALFADGFEFDETTDSLVPTVKGIAVVPEVSWLEAELKRRGWANASGHYEQALDNFGKGNWAAASSQLRNLFEDVVRNAGGTSQKSGTGQVHAAADALAKMPEVLSSKEAEFIKALWNVLHVHGSHPGLGDGDLARFRLLTITGYLRLLLTKLP